MRNRAGGWSHRASPGCSRALSRVDHPLECANCGFGYRPPGNRSRCWSASPGSIRSAACLPRVLANWAPSMGRRRRETAQSRGELRSVRCSWAKRSRRAGDNRASRFSGLLRLRGHLERYTTPSRLRRSPAVGPNAVRSRKGDAAAAVARGLVGTSRRRSLFEHGPPRRATRCPRRIPARRAALVLGQVGYIVKQVWMRSKGSVP